MNDYQLSLLLKITTMSDDNNCDIIIFYESDNDRY